MSLYVVIALLLCNIGGLSVAQTVNNCTPKWQRFVDQSSVGATQHHGPVSVRECLQHCVQTSGCLAVDVAGDVFPPGCWPHFNSSLLVASNTYYQPETNQYLLISRCSSDAAAASCSESEWERYVGYTAVGATLTDGPRTIRQCLDHCEQNVNCVGVDIDVNILPLRCWVHQNSNDLRPDNVYVQLNTSHYRLINRCATANQKATKCYNPEWEVYVDQNSVGASQYGQAKSLHECLDYCGSRTDCVAVDVDFTQQPPKCWPHFSADDLLLKNVYSQAGTNQYRLRERCVNTTRGGDGCSGSNWKVHRSKTALGGTHHVGPRTIQQCLDYCNVTAACVAVDIDVNVVPLRCWTHVNADDLRSDNIYSQDGTDHYQLITRCPKSAAATRCYNPDWEVFADQNSLGASKYAQAQSVQECLDYCGSRTDCVAVDVQMNERPPKCWPHFSADDLLPRNVYAQPGTNQYRLRERCAAGGITESPPSVTTTLDTANCRQSAWRRFRAQTALGGAHHVGPRTIQQCLDYCNATAACVAVDIDVNVVPLRCWTHVNAGDLKSDNIYSQDGTDHYQLITRCPNAPTATDCYNPEWEVFEEQNSVGATQYGQAQSVHECLDYCGSRTDCVAVDVQMNERPPKCWPHFSADDLLARNVYEQPGTNQYRLRERCTTGKVTVPATTQPNVIPTTALGKDCRESAWKKYSGDTALGGTLYDGPRTIQQCLDYCNATAACVAVDIDVNVVPLRCWTHVNAGDLRPDNLYTQYGTDHYQLIARCPNAPKATGCYDPEWEEYVGTHSEGSSQYDQAQSVQECLDYCGSRLDCVAVDVQMRERPPKCWPHFSADDLLPGKVSTQPGTNQYRLRKRCVSGEITVTASPSEKTTRVEEKCIENEWTLYKNQSAAGAYKYTAANIVQDCLDFCVDNVDCVAVDVRMTDDPPTCWPHFGDSALRADNMYRQDGVNHYRLTKRCRRTDDETDKAMSGVIIGLAVGLGVPLFILIVITATLICCLLVRRRQTPVEAVNTFFPWPTKSLNRRTSTVSSSTSSGYPHKDVEPLYDTPASENHYQSTEASQNAANSPTV